MRKACKALLLAGVCLILGFGLSPTPIEPDRARSLDQPNIVFILADDLDVASARRIQALREHLGDEGITFKNAFVTHSLCCPSRATILTGQYPHNHLVRNNFPPLGGFEVFRELGREKSTVATWLDAAGYRTAFFGKYLNGYDKRNRSYVPPGWDEWYGETEYNKLNQNGQIVTYPAKTTYHDDVLSGLAQGFVRRQEGEDVPFFMHLSVHAPHAPAEPARRYKELFGKARASRTPSFDEKNVSDKPEWVRRLSLTAADKRRIDELYRDRLRTMVAVDEMIGGLIDALEGAGKLDNTYLLFTSDNGYHMGQHGIKLGKGTAYEEDIRIPLMVRGPGVPARVTRNETVLNNDLAPTFADLAGVAPPDSVDGRSFAPLLDDASENDPVSWRTAFEIRHWRGKQEDVPSYDAVRTLKYLYVEYNTGERELYDLKADPYQLESLHDSADPALITGLKSRLEALRYCAGEDCHDAEDRSEK